jgi:hypothetical protein
MQNSIIDYFDTRRLIKPKYLIADKLGSIDVPYGVKPKDSDLRGSLRLGPFTNQLAWLVPEIPKPQLEPGHITAQSWSRFVDYSDQETVRNRSIHKGLPISSNTFQMLDAIGHHSVKHAQKKQAMWVSHSAAECMVGLAANGSLNALEAVICQSLPSGLLRPELPYQTSRLSGRLEPCLLYTPLNPFARGTINNT